MSESFRILLKLSYGEAPYDIHLDACFIGEDILASVTGGTRSHIGAVALAEPAGGIHPVSGEPARDESGGSGPLISIMTSKGHKDAILAEMFARFLCEKYGVNVCVTAGVHVEGADEKEIALMVENANSLLVMI